MTDIASLGPFIKAEPEAYRSFIMEYPDRILLASDVIASYDLRLSLGWVEAVRGLKLPEEAEAAVLWGNARRFLGGALRREGEAGTPRWTAECCAR